MIIIGISGKKRSGKDTVANAIRKELNLDNTWLKPRRNAFKIGFADALKQEVACACGVNKDFIEANKPQFRVMLQWWGTEFRRWQKGPNYWINKLDESLHQLEQEDGSDQYVCIIPDVRFVNEAEYIKENGYLIRVERTMNTVDHHPSETELDLYDFPITIENSGSIAYLKLQALTILYNNILCTPQPDPLN